MNSNFYKYFSLLFTIFCFSASANAQVYVNAAATGTNDGSSWANAYVNLQSALDNAASGSETWVAAGTYSPGSAVSDFFNVGLQGQAIYGGFVGTETMLSQRDIATNQTILSGDVSNDDVANDFVNNRSDNNYHVMWVVDTIDNTTIIDGFSIEHGNTLPATGSGNDRRGGGILSYGSPIIRNCTFTQNYGHYGGSLYPRGSGANNILVEDCTFSDNEASYGGAAVYLLAGGIFNDCVFEDSYSPRGGAVYSAGDLTTFNNCDFTNLGDGTTRGGAIYGSSGITLNNCLVDLSSGIWGGAIYATDVTNIDSCIFSNTTTTEAGGILCAFDAVVNITNSNFEGNAADRGGALYVQNDSVILNVDNCYFFANSALGNGGGIYGLAGAIIQVSNSDFDFNIADFGACIAINSGDGKTVKDRLTVTNSKFYDNISSNQGGAINISNVDSVFLTSCLIHDNIANGTGNGGGISFNSGDTLPVYASLMNLTLANNIGLFASNIAAWEDDASSGNLTIVMQNTILYDNLGLNYVVEAGSPLVVSNGGNLSSDPTLMAEFTNTNDLNTTDPLFIDEVNRDYRLHYNSPAVDKGIATNAPLTDVNGDPRLGILDMGAIEYFITVNTQQTLLVENNFDVYPNPVRETLSFSLENNWIGDVQFSVVNTLGQVMQNFIMAKNQDTMIEQINLNNLPAANYVLVARFGNEEVYEIIVKL